MASLAVDGPQATSLHKDCHGPEPGHILDEDIEEWRILQAARPIFTVTTLNWRIRSGRGDVDLGDEETIRSRNGFEFFKPALRMLPVMSPVQPLSCVVFDDCLSTLADVLKALSDLVDDRVLDSTVNSTTEYPKLLALEAIFDSKLQSGTAYDSASHFCSNYLGLEQPAEVYKTTTYRLHSFFSFWNGIREMNITDLRQAFPLTIHPTNWQDPRPAESARRLFHILNERVNGCVDSVTRKQTKHEILLQLNGFQFKGDSVCFETFFSCRQSGYWMQYRFFLDEQGLPDFHKKYIPGLCGQVYDSGPQVYHTTILDISIRESGNKRPLLYLGKTSDKAHISNPPTVSLETHISKMCSQLPIRPRYFKSDCHASFEAEDKANLALSLARCILYLFETPWTDFPWTADGIHFLYGQVSDSIWDFRRPYVLGILQNESYKGAKDETPEIRCKRSLTSFARLLLEIETSRVITLDVKSPDIQLHNILDRTNIDREYPEYYKAIKACFQFCQALASYKKRDLKLEASKRIQKVLYTTIIEPLERNLSQFLYMRPTTSQHSHYKETGSVTSAESSPAYAKSFHTLAPRIRAPHPGISNPRQHPSGNRRPLASSDATSNEALPQDGPQRRSKSKSVAFADQSTDEKAYAEKPSTESSQLLGRSYTNRLCLRPSLVFSEAFCDETYPVPIPSPCAMLSDAGQLHGDKTTLTTWTRWLAEFVGFRKSIIPLPVDRVNSQRVRVTVIDTGIDSSHPFISSMKWNPNDVNADKYLFYDFVQPNPAPSASDSTIRYAPVDDDGHGTFIAGLLFQLAPDIELSVARIGATRRSIERDSDINSKVARAIEHAVTEWNANIISLSLSCEKPTSQLRKAVKAAVDKDVVLMAATGNMGNRRGVPYPATHESVFKIFAANSEGFSASFTPQTNEFDNRYSYHVLGCDVVSAWKCKPQAETAEIEFCLNKRRGHRHSEGSESGCFPGAMMSGSSFATPIAAALLAVIYQFYDVNRTQIHLKDGLEELFKTPKAVSTIFAKMSVRGMQAPYNYLDPIRGSGNFFKFEKYKDGDRNAQGQTHIEFFAQRLADAINQGNI